ncbi:uncharacterized protein CLUP02_08588 [Colletotrichum lupini]|uniref:Uncharacterized protein n=1 Tax=Colletotrichum lupini TaxID=145971 RepID=A0A9Q8SU48_9PEZI|nr:uncharacterized protein CLUP02_08588 [Colletotrichum lupini]UQC83095.1 hypothetical protein CLUP02_08588 [Colletotrichum lupini]
MSMGNIPAHLIWRNVDLQPRQCSYAGYEVAAIPPNRGLRSDWFACNPRFCGCTGAQAHAHIVAVWSTKANRFRGKPGRQYLSILVSLAMTNTGQSSWAYFICQSIGQCKIVADTTLDVREEEVDSSGR